MTKTDWISVKDALPEVKEGCFAEKVIICIHDPEYEKCCPGHGSSVGDGMWMKSKMSHDKFDFHEMVIGGDNGSKYWPTFDEVTHWMYYPEPIQKDKIY